MTEKIMAQRKKKTKAELPEPDGLRDPIWAVVSFDRCEANGLTYVEAEAKMNELDARGLSGLCIVTNAAAARIAPRN